MTLSLSPDPVSVITWAGQFYNLPVMPDEKIKWLAKQLDPTDLANLKWLAPIQAELDRRKPGSEQIRVIEIVKANTFTICEKFQEVLAADGLLMTDLITFNAQREPTANRIQQAFELAISGRWELPQGPGWPFRVDSFVGTIGGLVYEVKSRASQFHNYNNCKCDDFLYRAAGKYRGWCKHTIAVWIISEALKLT